MDRNTLIVVGDRFRGFLSNPGVVTASELLGRLGTGEDLAGLTIAEGQGLHEDQRAELLERLAAQGVEMRPLARPGRPRADQTLTHKHVPENILVTVPTRLSEKRFHAALVIDDRNDLMADHMTGQHIQGLVLIEAARQTWTAVSEQFFAGGERCGFVIEEVRSRFEWLLFPLPAEIFYEVLDEAVTSRGTVFSCRVDFVQAGQTTAQVEARFRVVRSKLIEKHESLAARRAVTALVVAGGADSPGEGARHAP
jgi:hypothetical protein